MATRRPKITVEELLEEPFMIRTQEQKKGIVEDGRPTPMLKTFGVVLRKGHSRKQNIYEELKWRQRHFKHDDCEEMNYAVMPIYNEIQWLTGSAITQSFYCWPCLLCQPPGLLSQAGISNADLIKESAAKHEMTAEHIEAMFWLQLFTNNMKTHIYVTPPPSVQNSGINIEIIKRLTDVVCNLVAVQSPVSEPYNCVSSPDVLEVEKCLNTMQLLQKYDSIDKNKSDDAIKLIRRSPNVITDLIKAITHSVKQCILQDLVSSKYVSIILNQHSKTNSKVLLSTILRYVKDGKVHERCLGFHVFHVLNSLYDHVKKIARDFNLYSKCIAVSLDGALLPSNDLKNFDCKAIFGSQHCVLVPWYSHSVDNVLKKSLSMNPKIEHFFRTMTAIETCLFENNLNHSIFYDFATQHRMIVTNTRSADDLFVSSDFIYCTLKYRKHMVHFFGTVIANNSQLDADDIANAIGFREFLEDFITVFLLCTFSKIFKLTAPLNKALDSDRPDKNIDCKMVSNIINKLFQMHTDFSAIWTDASRKITKCPDMQENKFISLFEEIINCVIAEIRIRYSDIEKFKFCGMFEFDKKEWHRDTPMHLKGIQTVYPFDCYNNVSQILYESKLVAEHDFFAKNNVYDFHQHLHLSDLKHSFEALFNFSELILTLPFRPASLTSKHSILKNINKWTYEPDENFYLYDYTRLIYIESDYVLEVKSYQNFFNEVLHSFHYSMENKNEGLI